MFKITLTTGETIVYRKVGSIFTIIDEVLDRHIILVGDRYIFTNHIVSIIEE